MQFFKHRLALSVSTSVLLWATVPVLAEQSTFLPSSANDWFSGRNWSGGVIPDADTSVLINSGLATIDRRGAISGPVKVERDGGLIFRGDGSAENLEIHVRRATRTHPAYEKVLSLEFFDLSSAGNSTIIVDNGALIGFSEQSTAATATIHNRGGGVLFSDYSNAGDSTIINDTNGWLFFADFTTAENATVLNKQSSTFEVLYSSPVTIGSLNGEGEIYLGPGGVNLGALGKNDVISGSIHDGISRNFAEVAGNFAEVFFPGAIASKGAVRKIGSGKTTLTGVNNYQGDTIIVSGTLAVGGENSLSPRSNTFVGPGGSLTLNSFDQALKSLENRGTVRFGQSGGATLTVLGDFVGRGGVIEMRTSVERGKGVSDFLKIQGDARGDGTLAVTTDAYKGGPVRTDVKLVEIAGASDATFALKGNHQVEGTPALISGPYVYQLQKGALNNPEDGDWYLRSNMKATDHPAKDGHEVTPFYQPGVPVYEIYARSLLGLNGLSTFQQRTSNRVWGGDFYENPSDDYSALFSGFWTKLDGWHSHEMSTASKTGVGFDQNAVKLQAGSDGRLAEFGHGSLHGSIAGHFIDGGTNTFSTFDPKYDGGTIDTSGHGFSGALTWWSDSNFYIDAQGHATWYKSKLGYNNGTDKLSYRNDSFGFAVSLESGFHFALDEHLTIIPQAQLTYSHIEIDGFEDKFGAELDFARGESLQGRVGLTLNRDVTWEASNGTTSRTDTYGVANLHYEFLDSTQTVVSTIKFKNETDRIWAGLGAGGSYTWSDERFAVYGEAAVKTSLENPGDSYSLSGKIGFRANF